MTDTTIIETVEPGDEWIEAASAAGLVGLTRDALRKRYESRNGITERRKVKIDGEPGHARIYYRRDEVEALRPPDMQVDPRGALALAYIARYGPVLDRSGLAGGIVADYLQSRGYFRSSVSSALRDLEELGMLARDLNGTRCYRLAVTRKGHAWLQRHSTWLDQVDNNPPAVDEPAPAPVPVVADHPRATMETLSRPEPQPEQPSSNGHGGATDDVGAEAIARALLRQTVRTLSDSDIATLTAERDALRVHNDSLTTRLGELTERCRQAEAELRETRGVLHQIEAQLTPLLIGRGETQIDWLDARTRTDLVRLVSEAARWAG